MMEPLAPRIRLLIAENHAVMRMGLAGFLASQPDFVVVGEAASTGEALQAARHCRPDVILVDAHLPDRGGVDACRAILVEHPESSVLMLSAQTDPDAVIGSMTAGAAGCLLKEDPPEQLAEAVRLVARGESLPDRAGAPAMKGRARQMDRAPSDHALDVLAEHECRLLPLIAEGRTNREIAAQLGLSEHTVKTYVSRILRKLNLKRRAQAASFSIRHSAVHR
jgi:two-component system response regulator DevR